MVVDIRNGFILCSLYEEEIRIYNIDCPVHELFIYLLYYKFTHNCRLFVFCIKSVFPQTANITFIYNFKINIIYTCQPLHLQSSQTLNGKMINKCVVIFNSILLMTLRQYRLSSENKRNVRVSVHS